MEKIGGWLKKKKLNAAQVEHSYSSDKFTSSLYFDTRATQLHMGMPLLYLFTSLIKARVT